MGLRILSGAFLDMWHLVLGIPGPVVNQLMEFSCECALMLQISSRCLVLVMALSILFSYWTCGTCRLQLIHANEKNLSILRLKKTKSYMDVYMANSRNGGSPTLHMNV